MLELSGHLVGGYSILKRVAHGGMSSIYQALDPETGRVVAFKVLPPAMGLDPDFKVRFEREIEVMRKLEHPNIVPILDFGDGEGVSYIVMPFYERGTVKDRLEGDGVPLDESVRIIEQVSDALAFAHRHGVVHRDVKPSNMLIDENGNVALSDFGFAHLPDASMSLTGSAIIGTPAYMSPEQCKGDPVDGRSDQYSLAIVLFEMLTGNVPFDADTPMAIVVRHLNEAVPYPSDLNPEVSEGMQDVLLKALSKDPEDRYESIEGFNQAYQMEAASVLDPARRSIWIRRFGGRMKRALRKVGIGVRAQTDVSRQRRLIFRIAALILALGLSLTAAIIYWTNQQPPEEIVVEVTPQDFPLTLQAISTSLAPVSGTAMSAGEFDAAVAGTLTAIAPTPMPGTPTITPTPTATAAPTRPPGGPYPSPTPPPPTATATDTPTPAPIPVHASSVTCEYDGDAGTSGWFAVAQFIVHDSGHNGFSNAKVYGRWSPPDPAIMTSCTSGGEGVCKVKTKIDDSAPSATFVITGMGPSTLLYVPSSNHGVGPCTVNQE